MSKSIFCISIFMLHFFVIKAQFSNCYYYYTELAGLELNRGKYVECVNYYKAAFMEQADARPYDFLEVAKAYSMLDEPDKAIYFLKRSIEKGISWKKIEEHLSYFEKTKESAEWQKLECNYTIYRSEYMLNYDLELRVKLAEMVATDQYVRKFICWGKKEEICEKMVEIDSINMVNMYKIIEENGGYPTLAQVGFEGVADANVIMGHAKLVDPEVWKRYLKILEEGVKNGNTHPHKYAGNIDRYRVRVEGKPTLYGTFNKIYFNNRGKSEFSPIEDIENVDLRRASIGLLPLKFESEGINIPEKYRPELPEDYQPLANYAKYVGCD